MHGADGLDAQLATTSGNISPKNIDFRFGIVEFPNVFGVHLMQHINVRVLVVDSVSQLLDFGCLAPISLFLFLILSAVMVASECGYACGNKQNNDRVVG
ncbi:hypothetical protein [Xenorhabdus bovienii]|uniref:hypothetical protein n=1 Tax=Xenorhabdus bovienii TaxID=40576 RepID=UPI003DA24117